MLNPVKKDFPKKYFIFISLAVIIFSFIIITLFIFNNNVTARPFDMNITPDNNSANNFSKIITLKPTESIDICGFTLVSNDVAYATMNNGTGKMFLSFEMTFKGEKKHAKLSADSSENSDAFVSFNGCSIRVLSISYESSEAKILIKKGSN